MSNEGSIPAAQDSTSRDQLANQADDTANRSHVLQNQWSERANSLRAEAASLPPDEYGPQIEAKRQLAARADQVAGVRGLIAAIQSSVAAAYRSGQR